MRKLIKKNVNGKELVSLYGVLWLNIKLRCDILYFSDLDFFFVLFLFWLRVVGINNVEKFYYMGMFV